MALRQYDSASPIAQIAIFLGPKPSLSR